MSPRSSRSAARARFRSRSTFLATDKYRGLMVDFETFPKAPTRLCRSVASNSLKILHAKGMKLYVSVQARNADYDYAAVAAPVDGVVLMNYDEHYPSPELAGPVASQDWFTDNLKAAVKVIPQDKLISAIGNYGYDWVKKPKHGSLPPGVKDSNVSVQDAWLAARDSEADVDFDGDSLNPHFSYLDEHDFEHDIWFLDAVTALNQMRAAQSLGIKTFALWRLGSEDRSLWRVWDMPGRGWRREQAEGCSARPGCRHGGQAARFCASRRGPPTGSAPSRWTPATGLITDRKLRFAARAYRVADMAIEPEQSCDHL